MTIKRLILGVLTLFVIILVGSSLLKSFGEPQITNRLELYQTNLLLSATEPVTSGEASPEVSALRQTILGEDPLKAALAQYQTVRQTAESDLERLRSRLEQVPTSAINPSPRPIPTRTTASTAERLQPLIQQQEALVDQLDLGIGTIQAQQGNTEAAVKTWSALIQRREDALTAEIPLAEPAPPTEPKPASDPREVVTTAQTLAGIWSEPARILPNAEPQLQQHLQGWFRYVSLTRLYQLQQRADQLSVLQADAQQLAEKTLVKLALVGTVPLLGSVIGAGLLISLLVQRGLRGKQSLLAQNGDTAWETPWDWETIWQVLIVGFFFAGQVVAPLLVGALGLSFNAFGTRAKAVYALSYYLLMAGSGLAVLYWSLKPFFPLPEGWFRVKWLSKWPLWGIGGYMTALPLMIGVSLLNQQIWQGQGGSNPLLQIVLDEGDPVSLGIFLFTAAVAAPIFEETLFRGFLLPSLTRYVPVSGAIALSSLLFAIAHLSVSEVLPLTMLGAVLGVVYTRSRNLLAPMLLHSLWNSITMIGLFTLGSGN